MSLLLLFRGGSSTPTPVVLVTMALEVYVPPSTHAAAYVPPAVEAEAHVPALRSKVYVPPAGDAEVYVMPAIHAAVKGPES